MECEVIASNAEIGGYAACLASRPSGATAKATRRAIASLVALILIGSGTAHAATESRFAGTCSTAAGEPSWSSAASAEGSSDGSSATVELAVSDVSVFLICTGFGFDIPAGTTIDAINFAVRRGASGEGNTFRVQAGPLQGGVGVLAVTIGGSFGGVLNDENFPGAGDVLWGQTWTPADINDDAGFGVRLRVYAEGLAPPFNAQGGTASVDSVEITVTYSETPVPALDAVWRVLVALGLATIGILSLRRRHFGTPAVG